MLRNILIEHIDGNRMKFADHYSRRRRALRILIERGCLEPIGKPAQPASTIITEKGRAELSKILARQADELTASIADYSDALVSVGLHELAKQVAAARWPFRGESRPVLPVQNRTPVAVTADTSIV